MMRNEGCENCKKNSGDWISLNCHHTFCRDCLTNQIVSCTENLLITCTEDQKGELQIKCMEYHCFHCLTLEEIKQVLGETKYNKANEDCMKRMEKGKNSKKYCLLCRRLCDAKSTLEVLHDQHHMCDSCCQTYINSRGTPSQIQCNKTNKNKRQLSLQRMQKNVLC